MQKSLDPLRCKALLHIHSQIFRMEISGIEPLTS